MNCIHFKDTFQDTLWFKKKLEKDFKKTNKGQLVFKQ